MHKAFKQEPSQKSTGKSSVWKNLHQLDVDTGSDSAFAKATSQKIVKFLKNLILDKVVMYLKRIKMCNNCVWMK